MLRSRNASASVLIPKTTAQSPTSHTSDRSPSPGFTTRYSPKAMDDAPPITINSSPSISRRTGWRRRPGTRRLIIPQNATRARSQSAVMLGQANTTTPATIPSTPHDATDQPARSRPPALRESTTRAATRSLPPGRPAERHGNIRVSPGWTKTRQPEGNGETTGGSRHQFRPRSSSMSDPSFSWCAVGRPRLK